MRVCRAIVGNTKVIHRIRRSFIQIVTNHSIARGYQFQRRIGRHFESQTKLFIFDTIYHSDSNGTVMWRGCNRQTFSNSRKRASQSMTFNATVECWFERTRKKNIRNTFFFLSLFLSYLFISLSLLSISLFLFLSFLSIHFPSPFCYFSLLIYSLSLFPYVGV
jgi:hypothetical protein